MTDSWHWLLIGWKRVWVGPRFHGSTPSFISGGSEELSWSLFTVYGKDMTANQEPGLIKLFVVFEFQKVLQRPSFQKQKVKF